MEKIIIASGPVIVENGKVLLNQHGDSNMWKYCGGRVERFDLDLAENAAYKVKEEMGIDVEIIDPVPFLLHTKKETPDAVIDVILVHFLAKRLNSEIKPREDIEKWDWLDIQILPNNLAPNIIPTLKHFGYL